MTTSSAPLEQRLAQALQDFPDAPLDLVAARATLHRRTRGSARRRWFVAATAAVAVAAAIAALLLRLPGDRQTAPLPISRLKSGLPVGILDGHVFYTDPGHGMNGPAAFHIRVRADGTGTFIPPRSAESEWPVRFVGQRQGHVVLRRVDQFCGPTDDLTLDFRVHGRTLVVTGFQRGECSTWPKIAGTDLVGTTMKLAPPELSPSR